MQFDTNTERGIKRSGTTVERSRYGMIPPRNRILCQSQAGDERMVPEEVLLPSPVSSIPSGVVISALAFGSSHAVLLTNEGLILTMGDNSNGQCGVPHPDSLGSRAQILTVY